jgi:hypothetical protein
MAPAAHPLLGRKVGDRVNLELADGPVMAEVVSTVRKLPEEG